MESLVDEREIDSVADLISNVHEVRSSSSVYLKASYELYRIITSESDAWNV